MTAGDSLNGFQEVQELQPSRANVLDDPWIVTVENISVKVDDSEVHVSFDGRAVIYDFGELDELIPPDVMSIQIYLFLFTGLVAARASAVPAVPGATRPHHAAGGTG